MTRGESRFACQSCGAQSLRWLGRCPSCGSWHTIVEEGPRPDRPRSRLPPPELPALSQIAPESAVERIATDRAEFDRVLGGGIVRDSVVLLAGDPGAGKSTLLLQVAARVAERRRPLLYVSGEESPQQLKLRSERLKIKGDAIHVLGAADVDAILAAAESLRPVLAIVDSAQTLRIADLAGSPGTVGQVRESVARLAEHAKSLPYALFVVSHVTKEGLVAGPKVVEHLVDVVLRLEGDDQYDLRLLRAIKNRFGPAGEIGVFQMEASGLVPVEKYDRFFRPNVGPLGPGAATVIVCEGTRPLLVEVQALLTPSPYQMPNRRVTGLDPNRIALHLALLCKHGLAVAERDAFVNVAGGFRLSEPASDLGTIMAIASSYLEIPLPDQVAFVGEVGLRGELRGVHRFQTRLKEAAQYGLSRVIAPSSNESLQGKPEISASYFSELRSVLEHFFGSVACNRHRS